MDKITHLGTENVKKSHIKDGARYTAEANFLTFVLSRLITSVEICMSAQRYPLPIQVR